MGPRVRVVAHSDSGQGAATRIISSVANRLRSVTSRLDWLVVRAGECWQNSVFCSLDAELDALVVAGGDGAVHHALQACAQTGIALGVVPCGTGNDFARACGIPRNPLAATEEIVAALYAGHRRVIDLGQTGSSWFATVLCSGFDAAVNERANLMRWPRGRRRYDLAILGELAAFRPRELIVETETQQLELDATLVAIGNTCWYGGGVPICPSARFNDGLFDVTLVGRATRREFLWLLPNLRTGKHVHHPAVQTLRAHQVTLSGNDWPVYADGEELGSVPISVTCSNAALTILH